MGRRLCQGWQWVAPSAGVALPMLRAASFGTCQLPTGLDGDGGGGGGDTSDGGGAISGGKVAADPEAGGRTLMPARWEVVWRSGADRGAALRCAVALSGVRSR